MPPPASRGYAIPSAASRDVRATDKLGDIDYENRVRETRNHVENGRVAAPETGHSLDNCGSGRSSQASGIAGESVGGMVDRLLAWVRDDSGQDLVEYGLLAALISVAAVTVMISASGEIGGLWDTIRNGLEGLI